MDLLQIHNRQASATGFWDELRKDTLLHVLEKGFPVDVIREWAIVDITLHDKKVLYKWMKRPIPLTDDELEEKYGKL